MPTSEQWQKYTEAQNKYRYGQPAIEPKMLVGRQLIDATARHINRPDAGGANMYPTNYGFGATPPPSRETYQPLPATPGREWASLENKWGIKRPEVGSLPSIDSIIRPAPTPLEVGENVATPKLTSFGNGYGVAGANTSGRAGYSNRTYYDPSGNVVASGLSSATGRGGFVGAAADAEADRNLKARFEQDAAASAMAASMDRGAEAMRELRAAQIADFDGYKPGMPAVPGQLASPNPLSMPGDSIQDTRGRQAEYDQALEQVSTGNTREQKGAAATLTALNDLREKNLAAQVAQSKGQASVDPVDMGKFLLDQQKFNYTQNADANKFLLDKERFNYQQRLDKERLAVDRNEAEGKQSARQLERKKYMDEARKAFASEFSFSDPKAPREQIAGAVFDISQATGVPPDVVSQIYEQVVKELKIDYSKGGPKDPMKLNELVAARVTQKYRGQ